MSARHQLRIGNRRLGRDRAPIDVTSGPPVGETLQLARERKGVDLYRAERDTKIRLRYLAALEDGDWNELPAPVYTKGFLRNYAIYLGLEPDEIVDRWRDEMESLRTATRVAVAPPPMPIVEPGGRRFTITPAMVVAGSVALLVFLFVGYIGLQLLRFVADTPPVTLTYPANVVSQIDAAEITLQGTAAAGCGDHDHRARRRDLQRGDRRGRRLDTRRSTSPVARTVSTSSPRIRSRSMSRSWC